LVADRLNDVHHVAHVVPHVRVQVFVLVTAGVLLRSFLVAFVLFLVGLNQLQPLAIPRTALNEAFPRSWTPL